MRKMAFILLLMMATLFVLPGFALADGQWLAFINNPNSADRLHLRAQPSANAKSLGKYYNGAYITPLEDGGDWIRVRVGKGAACLEGWMQKKFLYLGATQPEIIPEFAMPLYMSTQSTKLYQAPRKDAKVRLLKGGQNVYLMGFSDSWWHVVLIDREGNAESAFVPAKSKSLKLLNCFPEKNPIYISNPDERDRLHLWEAPSEKARSLGKYYNGTVGELITFSDDGKWVRVEMYGRIGWMMRRFVMMEGDGPSPCKYAIPTVSITRNAPLYDAPKTNTSHQRNLTAGTAVQVLGLIDEGWLHIEAGGQTGFVKRIHTNFADVR